MPTESPGFVRFGLPTPRVLHARHGSFESVMAITTPVGSDLLLTTVSAGPGPIEILAGGIANPSLVNGAAFSLVAEADYLGTRVGEARVTTDRVDSATNFHSIPANTPWTMSLALWVTPGRDGVSSLGVGHGGVGGQPRTDTTLNFLDVETIVMQTQRVGFGLLAISLTSSLIGVAAVGVTLDWLRIVEYPEALP